MPPCTSTTCAHLRSLRRTWPILLRLAPENTPPHAQANGFKLSAFLHEMIGVLGWNLMSETVLLATILIGSSAKEAVAWSLVPRCIPTLQMLRKPPTPNLAAYVPELRLLGEHPPNWFTVSAWMQYLVLAINVLVAHACLSNASHAGTVLAAFVAFMAVNGTRTPTPTSHTLNPNPQTLNPKS